MPVKEAPTIIPASTLKQHAAATRAIQPRRFRPQLTLGYQQDLLYLANDLAGQDFQEQAERLQDAIGRIEMRRVELLSLGVAAGDLLPTVAYGASLCLLRDLVAQGWRVGVDDEGIYLSPPGPAVAPSATAEAKEALRASFAFARNAQLAEQSTTRFVRDMERKGVARLFADGVALARRLEEALRRNDLKFGVDPYLELVTPNGRDEYTGLRLQDIWRYARHFWSIPYQSTPGRNMFYLVRDKAEQGHPIIGIAALGNPVLGLSQRDDALGWSVRALMNRLRNANRRERRLLARHLVTTVSDGIADIYQEDLSPESLTAWERVEWLEYVERRAAWQRRNELAKAGDDRTSDYHVIRNIHNAVEEGHGDEVDWLDAAKTDLYRRKRAGTLARLIRAQLTFGQWDLHDSPDRLFDLLNDDDGRRAVDLALRKIKQSAVAEHVMEIITCGAVPPYGEVLGGKLVAMLLTAPRVVRDFKERYGGRVSLIASAMKGSAVRRTPQLAYLSTSSLYSTGSSQYNRIRIPASILGGEGDLTYNRLGITESFGTVHFAPDTATHLVAVARLADQNRRFVNHLFGEGKSPKLRALRTGLDALGLSSDTFLRHHSPRLLYGVALCENTFDLLLQLSSRPKYFFKSRSDGVEEISAYWRERWLKGRITRPDVISRLNNLRSEDFLLGKQIPAIPERRLSALGPPTEAPRDPRGFSFSSGSISFVERLYRSANSYADRLTEEELSAIHIDLGLEAFLLEQARAGKQVIVTGNPGDGKTHLIERLRKRLEDKYGALVITDANALRDSDVLIAWRQCDKEKRAFVLAINEWPLFVLRRLVEDESFPAVNEALRQVQQAVYYAPPEPNPRQGEVVVIDLSLRNVLAEPVIRAAIDRLTQAQFYEGLHDADPALANRRALLEDRVQSRLVALLETVARRRGHTTMRQLMGLIAYLITGGRSAPERLASQGSPRFHYANLVFEGGAGALFRSVRDTFDPAICTHPIHDADLWSGSTLSDSWLFPDAAGIGPQQLPEKERFEVYRGIKRRFFFEHEQGGELIDLLPDDERQFEVLVGEGQSASPTLVRNLLLALNRFFEPDCPETERNALYLWQSHRFDVRAPDTFVAIHRLEHQHFKVLPPQYASWVKQWLPDDQQLPRSFALVASHGPAISAQLLVDRDLYLTLREAERGLSRSSWSRTATRKVIRFVDRLHQLADLETPVADLRIRNTETDLDRRFEIQRQPVARYIL